MRDFIGKNDSINTQMRSFRNVQAGRDLEKIGGTTGLKHYSGFPMHIIFYKIWLLIDMVS